MATMPVREYAGAHAGYRINRTPVKTEGGFAPLYLREDDLAGRLKFLEEYNRTDVYSTIYTYYGEDKSSCPVLAPLYFDFDDDNVEENFNAERSEVLRTIGFMKQWFHVPEDMIELYFSGNKGFHIVVPSKIFGLEPEERLNEKLKLVMQCVRQNLQSERLDRRIYDRKRLFRLPNTVNSKSGMYKIPLNIEWFRRATFDEIKKLAKKPQFVIRTAARLIPEAKKAFEEWLETQKQTQPKKRSNNEFKLPDKEQKLLPCIETILKEGVREGQRNNTTVALASSLLQSGRPFESVEEILTLWNGNNEPPLAPQELHTTLMSAYSMLKNGRRYGCAAIKDLGLCIGTECRIIASDRDERSRGNSKWQTPTERAASTRS